MFKRFFDSMHRRDSGFLVRRYITFTGHIVAMAIMIMLAYKGDLTEGYFGIYVSFIAAHASMEKYIAHKPAIGGDPDSDGDGPYKPPKAHGGRTYNLDLPTPSYSPTEYDSHFEKHQSTANYEYSPRNPQYMPPAPPSSYDVRSGAVKPEE